MKIATTRAVAALVLLLWASPSFGALAVGAHLAMDHEPLDEHGTRHDEVDDHETHDHEIHDHETHVADHAIEMSELLQAAMSGHHHGEEAVPDHDHHVYLDAAGKNTSRRQLSPSSDLLPVPPALSPATFLVRRSSSEVARVPGLSSPPLFTANCALLI